MKIIAGCMAMDHSGHGECPKRQSCLRYAVYIKERHKFNAHRTCRTPDYPHYIENKGEDE